MSLQRTPPSRRHRCASVATGALALLALGPLEAEVFKCAGRDAVPTYQDAPCPPGKELRNFQTDPPAITVLPAPEFTGESRAAAEAPRGARKAPSAKAAPASTASEAKGRGDAAERKFVRPGMTEGEVIAKLGQPEVLSRGAKHAAARWSYLPSARDPDTVTVITFAGGIVTHVERKVSK